MLQVRLLTPRQNPDVGTHCIVHTLSEMLCTVCIHAVLPSKGVTEPLVSMSAFRAVVPQLVVFFLLMYCEPDFLRGNISRVFERFCSPMAAAAMEGMQNGTASLCAVSPASEQLCKQRQIGGTSFSVQVTEVSPGRCCP